MLYAGNSLRVHGHRTPYLVTVSSAGYCSQRFCSDFYVAQSILRFAIVSLVGRNARRRRLLDGRLHAGDSRTV